MVLTTLVLSLLLALPAQPTEVIVTCVLWVDAKGELGWLTPDEYDAEDALILSCGILVKEDGRMLTLALDTDGTRGNGWGSIPQSSILSRKDTTITLPEPQ